jgi:hypothetical protein
MLVWVTLRLVPHQDGERLPAEELRQEADRVMGGLTRGRSTGAVEDVLVARDATTGFLTVEGLVASSDGQAAIEKFLAFFRDATEVTDETAAAGPIGHVILEKLAETVDPATAAEPLNPEEMMEILAPLRRVEPPEPPSQVAPDTPRRRATPTPQAPRCSER